MPPTGRDRVREHTMEQAHDAYSGYINAKIASSVQAAHLGVVYKPFADSPGNVSASPATWWDYFTTELSHCMSQKTYLSCKRTERDAQAPLDAFTSDDTAP